MSMRIKKPDGKNADTIRDQFKYNKTLIAKVFDQLDLKDFLPAWDRGDSKPKTFLPPPENTANLKELKLNLGKRKPDINITTVTSLAARKQRSSKISSNEDRGDIRNEQNIKLLNKNVEKQTTEDIKEKSTGLPQEKEFKAITNEISSDSEKYFKVSNQNIKNKLYDINKLKISRKDKAYDKTEGQRNNNSDYEERKLLRKRNTFKSINKSDDRKADNINRNTKTDDNNKKPDGETAEKSKSSDSQNIKPDQPETIKPKQIETKPVKKSKEPTPVYRKPIIKTIKLNNDNRVYKAVTFVDQKEPTPLQIKIPIHSKKDKHSTSTNTVKSKIKTATSKMSVQLKPKKKEKKRAVKERVSSPVMLRNCEAPPTEVAKWAPSCISDHTKPYYEAWLDTTLAAITKCTKNDKLYMEKKNDNIIKTFKRVYQRPLSPELVYEDFKDERYTGRITVRHNSNKRM